jgi:hypothetical protein
MGIFSTARRLSGSLLLLVPASLFGQQIPLVNWTVPPYRSAGVSGGLRTMADISPGVGFVAMQPCRVVDTRGGGVFTGAYGPPALAANATRSFDIDSAPHCTGIPAQVEAYSLNFTVVNTTGGPGDLRAWPTGNPPVQTTSVLNWTSANVIIANATIIGAGTNGSIDVTAAGFGTHVLIDINGYFPSVYNAGNQFVAAATIGGEAAILGGNFSAATGSHGVGGFAGGAGLVHGVQGQVGPSALPGSSGVHGINDSTAQHTYGVLGEASADFGAAGVLGRDRSGTIAGAPACCNSAGVRGESKLHNGVVGISEEIGVFGELLNSGGTSLASGLLGVASGPTSFGVLSNGNAHVNGTFTATTKNFVQPHPSDPSKEIRYVSLEGPNSEVYFRGSAQISQGVTRIPIPDYFRMVATPGSYSALVTPVGAMATVAVLTKGEEGIVVQASRDVRIDYVVYAEREAVKQDTPIVENVHFRPDPNIDLLAHVPDSYRELMIQNGTLNPDGTLNVETAKRLGWDKAWETRSIPVALKP